MIKERKPILLVFVMVLLVGIACSTTQIFQRSVGIEGESQDAAHDEWIDESGAESPIDEQSVVEPDIEIEGLESSDSSGAQEITAADASLANTTLGQQIESGEVIIGQVESVGGGTQGEIIEITITNQSEDELLFVLPPGLVFTPIGTNEQNLMVLDGVEVSLQPDETILLSPYVICIEASAATPSAGSVYQIGYLESDDLLDFAVCVDEEADGTLTHDDIGLQFAAWSISNGGNVLEIPELTEAEEGALSGLMEELEAIPGMMEAMEEMMLVLSEEWLQRCGISIGGEQ